MHCVDLEQKLHSALLRNVSLQQCMLPTFFQSVGFLSSYYKKKHIVKVFEQSWLC